MRAQFYPQEKPRCFGIVVYLAHECAIYIIPVSDSSVVVQFLEHIVRVLFYIYLSNGGTELRWHLKRTPRCSLTERQ